VSTACIWIAVPSTRPRPSGRATRNPILGAIRRAAGTSNFQARDARSAPCVSLRQPSMAHPSAIHNTDRAKVRRAKAGEIQVRTASGIGIDPAFAAHRGIARRQSSGPFFSAQASCTISDQLPSCVRLPSLADDAGGTLSLRVPHDGTTLLWVPGSGEGGLDAGKVPAPGIGAALVFSSSVFGARPSPTDPARAPHLAGHPTTAPPDFPDPPLHLPVTGTSEPARTIAVSPSNPRLGSVSTHSSRAAVTRRARSEAERASSRSEPPRSECRNLIPHERSGGEVQLGLIHLRRERSRSIDGEVELKASALTAVPAHNPTRSAGRVAHLASTDLRTPTGAPRSADLPAFVAVSPPSLANAPGTTTAASSIGLTHSPLPTAAGRWAGGSGGAASAPSGAPA